MKTLTTLMMMAAVAAPAWAKVDLVTLPERDTVQLTIYNSADLTLVRESRDLTLREGQNRLQFSWENTLIDPTSLEMLPRRHADKIDILDLAFPPRVKNTGVWNIQSEIGGDVPVGITYLTSGLSWRAFYMGTLSPDESTMRLQGYVRVTNLSGEDYENAQTRLIVGQVHMVDEIAELARREHPFGTPYTLVGNAQAPRSSGVRREMKMAVMAMADSVSEMDSSKEIRKEGLSEYFLYTIEGTETIPHGWSKRLPSFEAPAVPVVNLYKFEERRYGNQVMRFLRFKNDETHTLGDTPIPGGTLRVYRGTGEAGHLGYEGQSTFKYIPVDEDVELNLGADQRIVVEPTVMDFKTTEFMFNRDGDIDGWDEVREFKIEVKNTREQTVAVEITRNVNERQWDVASKLKRGTYEKIDLDTFRFTLSVPARSQEDIHYTLTTHHGRRAE
ncbi:MAG: DUF4139 domain-containing protein [Verrucomicrobia bacterium]|nr:DUF4139 domain-containing protein [Verrucomicrobiota bacterium]